MLWFDRGGMDADHYTSLCEFAQTRRPRVLATAATREDDGQVVALPDRLCVRTGTAWEDVAWDDIVSGGWEPRTNSLGWTTHDGRSGSVQMDEPGEMPDLFRERVQASIVLSQHVDVPGTKGVMVTARRNPAARRNDLRWRVVPAHGTDLSAPGVREQADAALERVRADFDIQ